MAKRDPDCIFCKIVAGEIPSRRVYEDDRLLGFLDIAPLAPGHTLLIPKDHHERATDLPDDLAGRIGALLPRLSRAVMAATKAPGFNLLQSNDACAGQQIGHVHVHVIPRRPKDGLGYRWNTTSYEGDAADDWQGRIRRAMG